MKEDKEKRGRREKNQRRQGNGERDRTGEGERREWKEMRMRNGNQTQKMFATSTKIVQEEETRKQLPRVIFE